MDESSGRRRALAVAAPCALLAIGAIAAGVVAGPTRTLDSHLLEDTVLALAWSALAVTGALRGRLTSTPVVVALAWGVAAAANGWALTAPAGAVPAALLGTVSWAVAVGLAATLGVFAGQDPPAPRGFAAGAIASSVLMATAFLALPTVTITDGEVAPNPVAVVGAPAVAVAAVVLTVALAVLAIVLRARTASSPARRRRTTPVIVAAAVALVGLAVGGAATSWAPLVQVVTTPALPLTIAVCSRPGPSRLARDTGIRLGGAADPVGALHDALTAVRDDLGLDGLAIEVDGSRVAAVGRPGATRVPLRSLGRLEGELLVPRTFEDDDDVRAVLPPLAALLTTLRLGRELSASHDALRTAREDERTRVQHDLHDEVGPLLAAAAMQAEVAELSLTRDADRARDSLRRARAATVDALAAVRRIAQDLGPDTDTGTGTEPATGLRDALEAHATRWAGRASVEVQGPGSDPISPRTRNALVLIAGEAIGNAVTHAGSDTVTVRVEVDGNDLVLTVVDDGAGFDVRLSRPGVGLRSMRERAETLGGRLEVRSDASGTMVEVRVPTARAMDARA